MNKIEGRIELFYEGKEITYELSALMEDDLISYDYAGLVFVKDYEYTYRKEIECWDNDFYLINTLYKEVLIPWIEEKNVINSEEFLALLKVKGVKLEDLKGIKELIEKGIELKILKI